MTATKRTDERCDRFLSTYNFFTNSIEFRIHSSKALEKWKNVQSFQLNQLVNGKFYFPQDRREILLLKYDIWSRWLYEVENLCIELSGDKCYSLVQDDDIDVIITLAGKADKKYRDIITKDHREKFNTSFADIWLEVHEHVAAYLMSQLMSFSGLSFDMMFTEIVNLMVDIMQYTLIEIHELDAIFCKTKSYCRECVSGECDDNYRFESKTPFVVITNFSNKLSNKLDVCLVQLRLEIYKKYFTFDKVYVKNYTDHPLDETVIKKIENTGFEIDYRKSLIQN